MIGAVSGSAFERPTRPRGLSENATNLRRHRWDWGEPPCTCSPIREVFRNGRNFRFGDELTLPLVTGTVDYGAQLCRANPQFPA